MDKIKKLLFNPGPASVPRNIHEALLGEDIVHRGKEFEQLYRETSELVTKILKGGDDYITLLITGSGTAANEAMVSSFLLDQKVLVIRTDEFGDRLKAMCDIYEIKNWSLKFPKVIDLATVEKALHSNKEINSILVPYVETAVGIQHPIKSLGKLLRLFYPRKINLYVDGVSAFASTKIDVIDENIAAITSSAGKCIMAFPGISFVCCQKELFEYRGKKPQNVYLDLHRAYQFYVNSYQAPNTPAIQLIQAFKKALEIYIKDEDAFIGNYISNFNFLYREIKKIGFLPYVNNRQKLCNTTMIFYLPVDIQFDNFSSLLQDAGFIICSGKGKLKEQIFIVSVMGNRKKRTVKSLLIY